MCVCGARDWRCNTATQNSDVRTFLLIEIFARVVKNLLRLQLREKMKALRLPLEEPYRRLVVVRVCVGVWVWVWVWVCVCVCV